MIKAKLRTFVKVFQNCILYIHEYGDKQISKRLKKIEDMLVETMSYHEMAEEYKRLRPKLNKDIDKYFDNKKAMKLVMKCRDYTNRFFKHKIVKLDSNTSLLLLPHYTNFQQMRLTGINVYDLVLFKCSNGLTAITAGYNNQKGGYDMNFYIPHFYERYQERCLKDESLTKDEVIVEFMKRNIFMNREILDKPYKEYKKTFITVCNDGILLGVIPEDGIYINKTFLTMEDCNQRKKDISAPLIDKMIEGLRSIQQVRDEMSFHSLGVRDMLAKDPDLTINSLFGSF